MNERVNSTTERFARQSRDRRPITEETPISSRAEKVIAWVSILAALFLIGLLVCENGGPL